MLGISIIIIYYFKLQSISGQALVDKNYVYE